MVGGLQVVRDVEIPDEVLERAGSLLDSRVDGNMLYAVLGLKLSQWDDFLDAITQVQDLYYPAVPRIETSSQPHEIRASLENRGRRFLRRYWNNIKKEACEWWRENQGQLTGTVQLASLAGVIASALPLPWNLFAWVLALIAAILLRAGLRTVCEELGDEIPVFGALSTESS